MHSLAAHLWNRCHAVKQTAQTFLYMTILGEEWYYCQGNCTSIFLLTRRPSFANLTSVQLTVQRANHTCTHTHKHTHTRQMPPTNVCLQVKLNRAFNKSRANGVGNHWISGHQQLLNKYKVRTLYAYNSRLACRETKQLKGFSPPVPLKILCIAHTRTCTHNISVHNISVFWQFNHTQKKALELTDC